MLLPCVNLPVFIPFFTFQVWGRKGTEFFLMAKMWPQKNDQDCTSGHYDGSDSFVHCTFGGCPTINDVSWCVDELVNVKIYFSSVSEKMEWGHFDSLSYGMSYIQWICNDSHTQESYTECTLKKQKSRKPYSCHCPVVVGCVSLSGKGTFAVNIL